MTASYRSNARRLAVSISIQKSSRLAVLGIAIVVAPLMLRSSFAAEQPESDFANEAASGNESIEALLISISPIPSSVIAAPLIRAGLSAEVLSAVGVPSSQVSAVLLAAVKAWQADPTRLPDADKDYAGYRQKTDALRRKIRAGKASAQEIADYKTGMTDLAAAEAARVAALKALRDAACTELTAAQTKNLNQIHSNKAWDELPMEYRTVSQTEADWVKLRKALLNEKTCLKYDEDPDPALASHLSTCKSDPTVAAAKASCDATLGSCKAAWDAYMGN